MAGLRLKYVIEEVNGSYIGLAMRGKELYCNTIPLPSKAEADADLRAACYTAWGENIVLSESFYLPNAVETADLIYRLFRGEDSGSANVSLARHPKTKFQRTLDLMSLIPRGGVTTYAELARASGTSPRAVGRFAARNPFPLIIPCHRVVRSDLRIGGYSYGPIIKASLLMAEGVDVDIESGKIRPNLLVKAERLLEMARVLGVVGQK